MTIRISGKNMNIGDMLRRRIKNRIEEMTSKYFGGGYSGHVTIEKSGLGFDCDCMIHLDTGIILQAKGTMTDATICFEAAAVRIEKRLRRYKRRLKNHRHNNTARITEDASYTIMQSPESEEEIAEDFFPITIAESSKQIRTQSVADAVMQLDLTDEPVVIFTNAANNQLNVVYQRSDGNVGWIDPSRKLS